ncbi:MAG: carbohydrate binding domain-containing protein [Bacteroidaceae bacterium]|nr:carbohydrate binding domain-containing protein [Bacteroidaceae bacterium]
MKVFTKSFLALLLMMVMGVVSVNAKTEQVHATFENPSNTNTTWDAATKTFTWSTTYYNQLRNIGLPSGDISKYKKLVVDCTIVSGEQFRILFYKGGSNLTLYAKDGVNEFIIKDELEAIAPDDYNEYLLGCDEICLSGNNGAAPGEAVINDVYLETYDDEGQKVYATFENPSNTNTTWDAETKTFTWSTTYYNQLRNIGLPSGDISGYKKLVVDCTINSGEQFRILFYKGGSNLTLYAKDGVNEFIIKDELEAIAPDDYNEYLLACDEICLSGNNGAAPGEAIINSVYLETYPENESVDIPEIVEEEDPGKPEGYLDFTEEFPSLTPKLGVKMGNGEVVLGQRTQDVVADLSDYSSLTVVGTPGLKLVFYMNHEVAAQQNAPDYAEEDAGKYVFLDAQTGEDGLYTLDLTQFDKQDLNAICLPWDNSNKGTVWYILLKPAAPVSFADGKYYLKNVESGRYWGAGNSWGTQASLLKNPEYVTLISNEDGTYNLESQVSNGGTSYYFGGDYMDGAPVAGGLTIAASAGHYTIANGDNYYGYDGSSTVLGKNLAADSEAALWDVISEADMVASLAEATADAPVDATFLILAQGFGRNNRNGGGANNDLGSKWIVSEDCTNKNLSGGNNTNNCAESFHSVFTVSQTIADAPKGVYKLTAQGFYRQDGDDNDNLPVFFINDETSAFPLKTGSENSMSNASESFANGLYAADPIFIELAEAGDLTVGAKLAENTNLWCIWDNFELTYYGPDADVAKIQFADLIAQVEALRAQAEGLKDNENISAATATALAEALSASEEIAATKEAYSAAIAALTAANNKAEADIKTKAAIDALYALAENTNVYTAEAYETFIGAVDGYQAAFDEGTLTEAVVNPEIVAGWHSANSFDDLLLSAWSIGADKCQDFNTALYINTWSVEGESDGTQFKVPFFEYWTGDANSLGANNLTAVVDGVPAGEYEITAWVRVRAKNGTDAADATGITLSANDGEAVDVTEGEAVAGSQFNIGEYKTTATVGEDGKLTITFNVAEDNNISWLSFKNVKYAVPTVPADAWAETGDFAVVVHDYINGEKNSFVEPRWVVDPVSADNNCIEVTSNDNPSAEWDSQVFITIADELGTNDVVKFSMDVRADADAVVSTQSHTTPGNYSGGLWSDINITTEWATYEQTYTVSNAEAKTLVFNLSKAAEANNFYFDNIKISIEKAPEFTWSDNIIKNGDLEGSDISCFFATEQGVGGPFNAPITAGAGKDGSAGIEVQSADSPSQDWDTQFFIRSPYILPAGTHMLVEFDYKADQNAAADTQSHQEPGDYNHWACIGSPNFTTEWQHFSKEVTVDTSMDTDSKDFYTITFNLAKEKTATKYTFDNIAVYVHSDVLPTLEASPERDIIDKPEIPVAIEGIATAQKANGKYLENGQVVILKNGVKYNVAGQAIK